MSGRAYGRLGRVPGPRWVATDVEPHVVIRLKAVFPRIRLSQADGFSFPDDPFHCDELLWFIERHPLAVSAPDMARLRRGRRENRAAERQRETILTPDWNPPEYPGLRPGRTVRRYQAQAAEMAWSNRRLLLGDDVGLGKTFAAMALLLKPGTLPAAIVVESHLSSQWMEMLEDFTTLRVHVIRKTQPYDLPPADVYVFRYSNVLGWGPLFQRDDGYFRTAIYDEVQNLRTGLESAKGEACAVLSRHAHFRLAMSATPIHGMGIEIHKVMRFLDPDAHPLGTEVEFEREWCGSADGKVSNPNALGSHLRERHLFLRRTKGDVGQQMDRVNTVVEEVPYDREREKEVEDLAKALAIRTVSAPVFADRGTAARQLDLLMRKMTGVAKAAHVAAYVRMLLEASDRSVLLIGWHREVYRIWNEALKDYAPVMYTGSETPAAKARSKEAFVNRASRVMIMSMGSGSGLNGIQAVCSTVVFGELAWSGEVHRQVVGRLDRDGQPESTVDAVYLHADAGSDPPIIELLGVKASQAKGIVDPGDGVLAPRSESSRIQALAREFLRRRGVKVEETATPEDEVAPEPPSEEPWPEEAGLEAA